MQDGLGTAGLGAHCALAFYTCGRPAESGGGRRHCRAVTGCTSPTTFFPTARAAVHERHATQLGDWPTLKPPPLFAGRVQNRRYKSATRSAVHIQSCLSRPAVQSQFSRSLSLLSLYPHHFLRIVCSAHNAQSLLSCPFLFLRRKLLFL